MVKEVTEASSLTSLETETDLGMGSQQLWQVFIKAGYTCEHSVYPWPAAVGGVSWQETMTAFPLDRVAT